MGGEGREHLGGAEGAADATAHAGGAVEYDAPGCARHVLEYVAQHLAHALGVLAGEHLGDAHVRVGERHDEELMRVRTPAT